MAELKKEYTDIRNRKHTVEHTVVPAADKADRERIIEELFCVLTGKDGKIPV